MKINVVKIGGKTLESPKDRAAFLASFAAIEGPKVLVHGGGVKATELAQQMGVETTMVNGRRVTDATMLDIVVMTYGGSLNKGIVADLQALNVNAIGLAGADGNVVRAHKRPVKEVDFGFVGDVDKVNADLLISLIVAGLVPVLGPLSHDGKGQLLNTNADTVATETAIALSEGNDVYLNFAFDLVGVMKDIKNPNSVIATLDLKSYQGFQEDGVIADGMIPKLENAFYGIANGIKAIRICNFMALHQPEAGTTIS